MGVGEGGRTDAAPESVTIRGTVVRFWRTGPDRPNPLVLLHGLASDHIGLFELAAGVRGTPVVALDLPGFGRSQSLSGPHTLAAYADVVEELRVTLGLGPITLVGHSIGGSIALTYAARYPTALAALCLFNPTIEVDSVSGRLALGYYEVASRLPDAWCRLLLTSRPLVYLSDRSLFTTGDRAVRRRILERDYVAVRLADIRAVRESYQSLTRTPLLRYAGLIRVPTLLVTGGRDELSTPRALVRLSRRMPDARVAVVAGAGHLLPAEYPATAAALIDQFLRAAGL